MASVKYFHKLLLHVIFKILPTQKLNALKINPRNIIWDKIFKNGPRKICGRQPLKYLNGSAVSGHMQNYITHVKHNKLALQS